MKLIIVFMLAILTTICLGQGAWKYDLQYKIDNKPYTFSLLMDRKDGYDILKRNNMGSAYGVVDFLASNQQHLRGQINFNYLAIDYGLTRLASGIKKEYRQFFIDAIRFGVEVKGWGFDSRLFAPGKRSLEFKIDF